jgi:pimeloyl-ACP methyl ester carboxylesterase
MTHRTPVPSDSSTPDTPPAGSPRRRRRTFWKVAAFSLAGIVGVLGAGLAATSITNAVATASEEKEIASYGERVDVDGKKMNVVVSGQGERTIVLLPGFGTAAPALDFAPLTAKLEQRYRVVVVEPFGYGLSDQTTKPRTSANIVAEVHEALGRVGVHRYVLMGHSIAGVYGLEYIAAHRDEVEAFVGIDTSVPTQPGIDEELPIGLLQSAKSLGLVRLLGELGGDPYAGLPYTDEQKRQMTLLSTRNSLSPTYVDEMGRFAENFRHAQRLSLPADLPVLLFVQEHNTGVEGWMALHEEQAASVDRSELIPMDADHYLHHTESAAIAADTERFLNAG